MERFSDALANVPTELSNFPKLAHIKLHALQRIKFDLQKKLQDLVRNIYDYV